MFLGTKTFPKENAYNTYLTSHNGHSNAYTDLCNTNVSLFCSSSIETGSSWR
jgi:secreted Zn-dependent insulinase-like peptidase